VTAASMTVLTNPVMPDVKPSFLTLRLKSLINTNAATEYITIQMRKLTSGIRLSCNRTDFLFGIVFDNRAT
jgi:hypothetical protein